VAGFTIHAAGESDLGAALSLVAAAQLELRGLDRVQEIIQDAVRGSAEYRACVAMRDDGCLGVGAYGLVAGTVGTAALYAVVVAKGAEKDGIGAAVVDWILADLTSGQTRLVVAEFPGHRSPGRYRSLLEAAGFAEESQVEDYFEDGVPLVQYRLALK
jgi:ribosomal protein S18 acetylase RimI-like enzyme